jgi:hypothetical protein
MDNAKARSRFVDPKKGCCIFCQAKTKNVVAHVTAMHLEQAWEFYEESRAKIEVVSDSGSRPDTIEPKVAAPAAAPLRSPVPVDGICPVCDERFISAPRMLAHLFQSHMDNAKARSRFVDPKKGCCMFCQAKTKNVVAHVTAMHLEQAWEFFEEFRPESELQAQRLSVASTSASSLKVATPPADSNAHVRAVNLELDSPEFWQTLASVEKGMATSAVPSYDENQEAVVCTCGKQFSQIGDLLLHCWEHH